MLREIGMKEEEMKESVNQSVSQSVIVCGKKKGELKKIAVSVDLPLSITQLRRIVATENEILNQLLFFLAKWHLRLHERKLFFLHCNGKKNTELKLG